MIKTIFQHRFLSPRRPVTAFIAIAALILAALTLAAPAQARYAAMVVEPATGKVLFARNADTRNYPASLTKMMTLYLLFEAIEDGTVQMDSKLRASRRAAGQPASKLGLNEGDAITVEQAILALVVKSANDVATVVAEGLAKSEVKFAQKMTRTARRLGMNSTTFRNASGLPNRRQLSTARDMARLAIALQRDFPQYYHFFGEQEFVWRGETHGTHNKLLGSYAGTDGMKTGYIRASGFNLVASTERDGQRLVGVVFGGRTPKSRNQHMAGLLDLGFQRLHTNEAIAQLDFRTYRTPRRFAGVPTPSWRPDTPERNEPELVATEMGSADTDEDKTAAAAVVADWAVQVGAFQRLNTAKHQIKRLARSLPHLFAGKASDIDKVTHDGGTIVYRARFTGLPETRAREVCEALERRKVPCVAVPPAEASVAAAPTRG
jgi:D-alanyl-D-alanine carboxypeptidase